MENWREAFIKSGVYWAMMQGLGVTPMYTRPSDNRRYTKLVDRERESTTAVSLLGVVLLFESAFCSSRVF